jgi:protein phosphatase 1L
VFDGHGGQSAATFAAQNLERHISMAMEKQMGGIENIEDAMKDGYMALDSEFLAKVQFFF